MKLSDERVHLFVVPLDAVHETIDALSTILSAEERARAARFHFDVDRDRYIVSHALVRRALSSLTDVEPHAWTFVRNRYGMPEILGQNAIGARFNLSRTAGMVVCAIGKDRELGVDVEDTERDGETLSVADSFFARSEVQTLNALPIERRRARFFELWTLKESYIKARGMGLSIPLDRFAFSFDEASPRISIDESLHDVAEGWRFTLVRPNGRHLIALAVRGDVQMTTHESSEIFR